MIKVTDHALVRYLERVHGIDMNGIRQAMAEPLNSQTVKKLLDFGGGARCKIKVDDVVYCVRGKTVITCLKRGDNPV